MRTLSRRFLNYGILIALISLPLVVLVGCGETSPYAVEVQPPPETEAIEVADIVHGVEIVDPYRWLEDQESPETREWIDAQNAYTDTILEQIPGREALEERFARLMKTDVISMPMERGGRYFYSKRAADQDLFVVYVREGLDGEERVLIDPHPMSEDLTVSVGIREISHDGRLVAYAVRRGGADEVTIRFLDVDTGEELPDTLREARYYNVSLMPDKSGYYFTRREPEGARLYYREMGADPANDKLVFGEGVTPEKFVSAEVTDDGRWLVIGLSFGWTSNNIYLKDLSTDGEIFPVIEDIPALFYQFIYVDGRFYVRTNWEAPNGRVLLIDPEKPLMDDWIEVIPQRHEAVLRSLTAAGGKLFALYLENVQSKIVIFNTEPDEIGEISFDAIGTVGSMLGRWESNDAFFIYTSFHIPTTIYHYNVSTGEKDVWAQVDVPVDSENFVVKQAWYESKDGTSVPMFIVHAADLELDGNNPVYLTGYGGFNSSLTPSFSPVAAAWIQSGGVFAVPNLRGGGEFGEDWHEAGKLANKQNVFDDFIAAAEYLVDQGYTKPEKIAIRGGSNGGLLVSAAVTQRPDLFGAVICTYPLIDMVRYHMFLVGSTWISEYGSADDPEQFEYIYKYSPYHHVTEGENYPAVLFITGDADTRVAPLHARKMTALMQVSTASEKPIMLRYHTKAGHSGGVPLSRQIEDAAETMLFLFWQLGIKPIEAE